MKSSEIEKYLANFWERYQNLHRLVKFDIFYHFLILFPPWLLELHCNTTLPTWRQKNDPGQQARPAAKQASRLAGQQASRPASQQASRPAAQLPSSPAAQQPSCPAAQPLVHQVPLGCWWRWHEEIHEFYTFVRFLVNPARNSPQLQPWKVAHFSVSLFATLFDSVIKVNRGKKVLENDRKCQTWQVYTNFDILPKS